jgi:hypothetical protein
MTRENNTYRILVEDQGVKRPLLGMRQVTSDEEACRLISDLKLHYGVVEELSYEVAPALA